MTHSSKEHPPSLILQSIERLNKLLAIVTTNALFLLSTSAGELEFALPEDVGLSSASLRKIENVVGSHLDDEHLAGAVTMVLRKGKIAHLEAHGWQDTD